MGMTPDFIAPDPRRDDPIDTDLEDLDVAGDTPVRPVKVYDGLVVDPNATADTIGADANGD